MVRSMGFVILAAALFASLLILVLREKSEKRRLALEKDLPIEQRLPRHYRSFAEVEKKLWLATEAYEQKGAWENMQLSVRPSELRIVRDYLAGLREDFHRGNRIFGAVILRSPNISFFTQLEFRRLMIQLSFHFWYRVICARLRTRAISVTELRRITDIVASLAYQVRIMLSIFENSGNTDVVQSILKNS